VDKFITWEFIGTFAGAVAVVVLIVQWLKLPIDRIWKIPTRIVVWIISMIVLFAYTFFKGTLTPDSSFLIMLNSILITMTALGTYDVTVKKLEQKKAPPGNKDP
jgi:hypothetical protein